MLQTLAGFPVLLRDPRLLGYALSGGFFYGGAYAFIAGSPRVYIEFFRVSPQSYGWLFGMNIVGIMAMNVVNGRLLLRLHSDRIFRLGSWIVAAAGVAIAASGLLGLGGLPGLLLPILVYMSMNGFIVANSVAGALFAFPEKAGSASSVLGAFHFGSGIVTAAVIGWSADPTARTMAMVMGACGLDCLARAC